MQIKTATMAHVAASPAMLPRDGLPQVAVAGRSNVGKSSLINALLNRRRLAYTSATPGKTRLLNFFLVNQGFYFVDLPGYGYAAVGKDQVRKFKVLVEAYLDHNEALRACLLLLDPKRPVGREELDFLYYLATIRVPAVVVFTRWDRVRSAERVKTLRQRKEELGDAAKHALCVSARTRDGIEDLWRVVERHLKQ